MSEYGDLIKGKCDAFADRVVKLNDYLLNQESLAEELRSKKEKRKTNARGTGQWHQLKLRV